VVGILIALQINNWNELRKGRVFEKEILTQIRINIKKDQIALTQFAANGKSAVISANKVLSLQPNETHDSLKYWLGDVIQFDRFQPLSNGYEALKSKGLEFISNKQLRFLLGTYYDDKANFIGKAVEDVEWAFMNEWLPMTRKYVVDFKFKQYMELNDYSPFNTSSDLRSALIMNRNNWEGSASYMEEGIQLVDSIITLINEEIK
jgi:hypothetical protein